MVSVVLSGLALAFSRYIWPTSVSVSTAGAYRLVQGTVVSSVTSSVGAVSTVSATMVGVVVALVSAFLPGSRNFTTSTPVAMSTSTMKMTRTTTRAVLVFRGGSPMPGFPLP